MTVWRVSTTRVMGLPISSVCERVRHIPNGDNLEPIQSSCNIITITPTDTLSSGPPNHKDELAVSQPFNMRANMPGSPTIWHRMVCVLVLVSFSTAFMGHFPLVPTESCLIHIGPLFFGLLNFFLEENMLKIWGNPLRFWGPCGPWLELTYPNHLWWVARELGAHGGASSGSMNISWRCSISRN